MQPLYLQEQNSLSGRFAVAEDDGTTVWFYLTATDTITPICDVWLSNSALSFNPKQEAPLPNQPPPAPIEYTGKDVFYYPGSEDKWSLLWSANGHCVAIMLNGNTIGFINAAEKTGYCRNIIIECAWGNPWNEEKFQQWFQQ